MWRQLPVVQKPWQGCQGKRYQELGLLEPLGAAAVHVGAAQGPGGSGPGVEGGPLAGVPDTGWLLGQVKVERNQDQDQVKVQGNQAKVKVERNQDQEQDAHLTRPAWGRESGQPCGSTIPPASGAGGVQAGPGGQRGGTPDCPAGPGGQLRLCGFAGTTWGVRHDLRQLVETTYSLSPIRMVKVWKDHCRTA